MFVRPIASIVACRLGKPRRFVQVLSGPRQAGKTTLIRQVLESLGLPSHYASADEPALQDRRWVAQQWEIGRPRAKESDGRGGVLVLDEVHKVSGWSEAVKRLWDEDTSAGLELRVALLGSAPLLLGQGLTESLAGRFEIISMPHWSFVEMRQAFGFGLDEFVYFGGYPGAAPLATDRTRWSRYILDSLIETTLARDILLLTRIDKPALLRRLFQLGCALSGQIVSYRKMLGQLQDAGNTTTLAHYLDLLAGAGMLMGLSKFSGGAIGRRASSPKLQVLNTALMTAAWPLDLRAAREDRQSWGRLIESAVGAHLVNSGAGTNIRVTYWRSRQQEVDFIIDDGQSTVAIEVKSGLAKAALPGIDAFSRQFRPKKALLVGGQGVPLEEFLSTPAGTWLER
ncbi:MAG: ATP-binding protein [Planctomycetes bacterium]|nr:ATP-binding protein [Planctomycetota bacterium]